ncbi:hypothetical protein [Sphingomonas sp. LHG3406-1]|uniref:hypothetical protein n=1 Tax=Sphingomonas sp. LHG3406-1 TaxID=2804617 RepID=UPI00262AB6BF|nr:hypothetical protein [Sphingomonas sp. LHG3406-1]
MRRLFPLAALILGACATTPRPAPPAAQPRPEAPPPVRTNLSGLAEPDLVRRFGAAPFRVSEGPGLKLQWQSATCVLDTYLYPPQGGGAATVLHADARRPLTGETIPVEVCVASFPVR